MSFHIKCRAVVAIMLFWAGLAVAGEMAEPQKIPLGDMEILGIVDARGQGDASLIPGLDRLPEFAGLFQRGAVPGIFKTYLFKTGDHLVLVDAGWGSEQQMKGDTLAILKREGIAPEAITDVLITHLDWDHIGGLTQDGKAVFPNATLWISQPEYAAWIDGALKGRPDFAIARAKKLAEIYKGKIRRFNFGEELLPGVKAIDASGHTPGHTAYEIASGKDRMLIVGDLMHLSQVQLPHPEMSSKYDLDPQRAAQSREKILGDAVQEKEIVAGMHFPMVSNVLKREDGGYMMREAR